MEDPKYISKYFDCEEIDQRLLQGYYDDFVDKTGYSGDKDSFLIDLFSSINLLKDKRFSYLPANIGLDHFPEWSSGNTYIKGKVVFHNSLLFRANSTHTSGASFDDDASLWSTTTLSEWVEESLTSTITVDEMVNFNPLVDEGSSYLAGFLDKPSRYVVTKEVGGVPVNVGILEIISDSSQHVYTQKFTTHYTLQEGTFGGSHDDARLRTYYRSYSVDSPVLEPGWSAWQEKTVYKIENRLADVEKITSSLPSDTIGLSTIQSLLSSKVGNIVICEEDGFFVIDSEGHIGAMVTAEKSSGFGSDVEYIRQSDVEYN